MGINLDQIKDPKLRATIEASLGVGRQPTAEVHQPAARPPLEADLHDKVEDYCRAKGWYYVHSRLDRRTTTAKGVPDFCIALPCGRMIWLELKRRGGKATLEQNAAITHLRHLGHAAYVMDNWVDIEAMLCCCPHA